MDRPTQNTRLPLPDPEIVDLYWARNERAIDETDFKYKRFLYTIAQNIIHDRMDSEECLNDTYLGAWQQIPPAKPDPLQAFLAKIMRHIAIDRYRQKSASKRIPSQLSISIAELGECISPAENPEEALLTKELARILNRFVKDLEDKDEFIFVCRYYFADRIDVIAQMIKASPRSVYRTLAELRAKLKELLEKEGYQ